MATARRLFWVLTACGVVLGLAYSLVVVGIVGRQGEYLPPVDPDDEFAVELRRAHKDLNSAVGWDDWRPRYLNGTALRLRRLAAKYPNATSPLIDAANRIERAVEEDNRFDAVIAHRAVAGLESLHRLNKRRKAPDPSVLPPDRPVSEAPPG